MNRQQKKSRSFERLETRACMAGNVTTVMVEGSLFITGDGKGNTITLTEIGDTGRWSITGFKTSINGKAPHTITAGPVTDSINIDLGGGNDKVSVHDGNLGAHLSIVMGAGNDSANVANLQLGTALEIQGNDGNDKLFVNNVHVSDPLSSTFSNINMGTGNDKAKINAFTDQDLQLLMGTGNDNLKMTNSAFLGGPFQRLSVDTGDGNDSAKLFNNATGPLNVNVGTGKNNLKVNDCDAVSAFFLNLGSGSISGNANTFGTMSVGPNFGHATGQFAT